MGYIMSIIKQKRSELIAYVLKQAFKLPITMRKGSSIIISNRSSMLRGYLRFTATLVARHAASVSPSAGSMAGQMFVRDECDQSDLDKHMQL